MIIESNILEAKINADIERVPDSIQILSILSRAIVSRNTSVAEAVMELRAVHNIRDNIGKS